MGLSEVLGLKSIKLSLQGYYENILQLYDAIKELNFGEAGSPNVIPFMAGNLIVWPEIDEENQVQIFGKNNKFTLQRSSQPACGSMVAKNLALSSGTENMSGASSFTKRSKKVCMAHVDLVARVLEEAGI